MTRKHYIALAAALRQTRPEWADTAEFRAAWDLWFSTVQSVATALGADNFRFDRARFIEAAAGRNGGRS